MHPQDWSARVFHDPNAILPDEGRCLIRHVDVLEGWGETYQITVFAAPRCSDPLARTQLTADG